MNVNRRVAIALAASALALPALLPGSAAAQTLIQRPVKIIVPFTPGTGMDILARIIGEQMKQRTGQTVVVENKPGASGNIGSQAVAQSPPDGYTLMVTANTFVMTPPLYKTVPYDVVKDFAPVGLIAIGQMALAVHPSVKATNLQQFIAEAKAQPGRINYASPGNGTPQHLAMESFKLAAGIDLTHVPYRGSAPAVQDLLGGQVSAMILPVHTAMPYLNDNRVRILGITSAERSQSAPQIPTLAEQGVAGFEVDLWYAMYAPGQTPPDMIAALNKELNAILADPGVKDSVEKQGLIVRTGTPEALARLTAADLAKWTKVVNEANIKAE